MKTIEVKAGHTPGPWVWEEDGRDQVVSHHPDYMHSLIAKLAIGENRAEEDANARLIAAAPELLEALEEIANRGPVPGYEAADALRLRLVGTQTIARSAIAKATSQTVKEAL